VSLATCDVAVVGGGLVGLAVAYELASRDAAVTVIDAAHAGRATDAGAGILSPETTAVDDDVWFDLMQGAGRHYPELLQRLRSDGADTGPADYANCGLLSLGLREREDAWFGPFADLAQRRSGSVVTEIDPEVAVSHFPPLGTVHRALYNPAACRVDGRGMASALRQGALARGVQVLSGSVRGLTGSAGSVQHLQVDGSDDVVCGALVVAGGAWSATMGEWLSCALPITPTKGQIVHLAVAAETARWPIVQPLLTHYLVPWPDGRVACGGTFENAGYSSSVTAAGVHELLRECLAVAPGLAQAEYLETRVGLRPTSVDDRPVVGGLPGWRNAWVATGHGANGLLLGPFTAALLAARISGEPGDDAALAADLGPARFG